MAIEALLVASTSQLLAVLVLGMWTRDRLAEVFGRGDLVVNAALVRSMQLNGWYSAGQHLGAPNGQDMVDFPLGGEHLQLLGLRLLSELPISAVSVVNLYYLLSFGLLAGVAHLLLRSLGSDRVPAAGASLLYAFLPYHFERGRDHLFLSVYVSVPLAVLLAVWVADGRLRWRGEPWRWAVAGACILVIGASSSYYAVFGSICIAAAAAVGSVRTRNLRPLVTGAAIGAAIALVLVANLTPNLLHRRSEGQNIEVANRGIADSEVYGLRPASLVVPEPTHRIPALASRGRALNAVPFPGERGSYVGFVGALGLAVLLGACLAGLGNVKVPPTLGALATMAVVILLVGARGGGGFLVALAGFTDIRAWGRTSVVIALLGLGALSLAATAVGGRVGRLPVALATLVLVILGLLDQVPLRPLGPRSVDVAESGIERKLVLEMERVLPVGATVYQMPYVRFPESGPTVRMTDYDQLRPYVLGGGRLRWSSGGLRGRSADWQELWAAQPPAAHLKAVAAAGFSALWIDRRGYADQAAGLLDQVGAETGASPRLSDDGKLAWYDLRPYAERIRGELGPAAGEIGRAVTSIPRAVWTSGFSPIFGPPPGLRNVDDGATLSLRAAGPTGQAGVLLLSVEVPDGVSVAVQAKEASWRSAGSGRQRARLSIEVGERPEEVRFSVDGARSIGFTTLLVVDAAVLTLLPEPAPAA